MATLSIATPDPGFTGVRAGVAFRDGRGEVEVDNASALAYFARHGYAIGAPATPTKKELLTRAVELGLDLPPRATVAEISDAIAATEASLDEPAADEPEG